MREIACDESGYEGQRLIGATTDVFAHGSVCLGREAADAYMAELRRRIRSPATEYKATHLLRPKHRKVLEWLLAGPLAGHVFLIDKAFYVVRAVLEVLLQSPSPDSAAALVQAGRSTADPHRWEAFLITANDLLRTKDIPFVVERFAYAVDHLDLAGPAGSLLATLGRSVSRAPEYRAALLADPQPIPVLDPLIPSIVGAVGFWGPVTIVHDRQTTLTPSRVDHLRTATGGDLKDLQLVDSFSDARVQLADVLAGVARKIASDELNGRGDPRLVALLRSYVDATSIWGDSPSWSVIGP